MKKRFLKSSSYVVLAAMLVFALAQLLASGRNVHGAQSHAGKLEGTWHVDFTSFVCETGAPRGIGQALNTYLQGGSMLETGNGSLFRSPGHGTWQHVGGRNFTATLTFFRFSNTNGAFIGTARATKNVTVGDDDNEFTATLTVEFVNQDGTVIPNICTTETARRFE